MTNSMNKSERPVQIKAAVVVYYHTDKDPEGMEGEFKHWMTRYGLSQKIPFTPGDHDIYMNDDGVMGFVAGIGVNTATAAVMGLGMDPRFDFSKSYWLIAGVGGANPQAMTIGSVAVARYVIDADKKHVLDPREMPESWRFGTTPYGNTSEEFPLPLVDDYRTVFRLNQGIANWVIQHCKGLDLAQFITEQDREQCARYTGDSAAREKPKVMLGEVLAGDNFWHGRMMNEWATAWVDYWTEGKGQFSISCCEDAGVMTAFTLLANANRIDCDRIIVTRSASNFVCQWEGATAGESLAEEDIVELTGLATALESAYTVGTTIVNELVQNWSTYESLTPSVDS